MKNIIFPVLLMLCCVSWSKASNLYVDKIVVYKAQHELHLIANGQVLKVYRIALGFNPLGTKRRLGDGKTPEGTYYISEKNPKSSFHLGLKISYPSIADIIWAREHHVNPGGEIYIHGWPNDEDDREETEEKHGRVDWTYGCIAVTDTEIEEIYTLIDVGTPIEIFASRF